MSSPEPLCGAPAGFTLVRFLVFYILANWFPNHRTSRTSKPEYSEDIQYHTCQKAFMLKKEIWYTVVTGS